MNDDRQRQETDFSPPAQQFGPRADTVRRLPHQSGQRRFPGAQPPHPKRHIVDLGLPGQLEPAGPPARPAPVKIERGLRPLPAQPATSLIEAEIAQLGCSVPLQLLQTGVRPPARQPSLEADLAHLLVSSKAELKTRVEVSSIAIAEVQVGPHHHQVGVLSRIVIAELAVV